MKFSRIYIIGSEGVMGKLLRERISKFYPCEMFTFDKGDKLFIPDGSVNAMNMVIVATPISVIGPVLEKIAKINPKFTFVTEIGSVKGMWADYMQVMSGMSHPMSFFASTHPMVGPLAKDWDVLDWKRKCVIISGDKDSTDCHKGFMDFWQDLGFVNEVISSAKRHDEVIGLLSHLSHYMIKEYVRFVKKTLTPDEMALAGTSFETFVKMAEGAERLQDIYEANRALPKIVEAFCKDMSANEVQIPKVNWFAPDTNPKKKTS